MAKQSQIIKLIRTGNIFVDEYWVLNGETKKIAGINEVIRMINRNGRDYDTSAISDDLERYKRYLERKIPLAKIQDKFERARRFAWLEVEMGAYEF